MSRGNRTRNVAQFPQQSSVQAQASAWIARLDRGELSPTEHAEFRQWINRSPQHREEIRRLHALWDDLNLLTELAAPAPFVSPAGTSYWKKSVFAVTAMVIAVALSLFIHQPDVADAAGFHTAAVGAQKAVELADGSTIRLNTDSHAKVEYSDNSRIVRLLKGEAYFDVAPDPERPFLVYAGTNTVRAVGTAFSVRLEQSNLEVVVTEGKVELSDNPGGADEAGPAIAPIAISAGHMATLAITGEEELQAITQEEIQRKLSWLEKMLVFADAPLSEVISEFNRYTSTTIVISDPGLSQMRIGGYFKAGDTEALLGALESSFGVKVIKVDDQLVYLARATPR